MDALESEVLVEALGDWLLVNVGGPSWRIENEAARRYWWGVARAGLRYASDTPAANALTGTVNPAGSPNVTDRENDR